MELVLVEIPVGQVLQESLCRGLLQQGLGIGPQGRGADPDHAVWVHRGDQLRLKIPIALVPEPEQFLLYVLNAHALGTSLCTISTILSNAGLASGTGSRG